MKTLVVSDTHGMNGNLIKAYERVKPVDMMIHLGDCCCRLNKLEEIADCEIKVVSGNGDQFYNFPNDETFEIGKYTVFITHGHRYAVNANLDLIKKEAINNGADILMFGHLHKPMIKHEDGLCIINPGSLTQPRQDGHKYSFIIMEIDNYGESHFTINYL